MTFPLRHILFLSFVGLSVPHISSRSSGNCRCSVGPGFFRFGCQKRGARSLALLSNRRLGKSEEGAGGGCSRLRRSTDDRGQRAAAAVESRVREQFVSQSQGPPRPRAGSRDHRRPRAQQAGRPAHPRRPAFPRSAFHRTDDGGMRNEEEREIKRGTVAHSPDIR